MSQERVEVRLGLTDSLAEIVVSDTGQGIRPDFLPFVFERFRQADSATTRAHGGLGLGLAIVRHLVEAHGGTVRAESPGPGQGAVFTVTLPLMRAQTAGEAERRHATVGLSANGRDLQRLDGLRILLVDDDLDSNEAVGNLLASCGADVRAAGSAAHARDTNDLDETLLHVQFDGSGNRVGAQIVERPTDGTAQIACDKVPASAGGQLYLAEDFAYSPGANCFRDTREALIAKRYSNGAETVLLFRIDTVEGLDACNDALDPADDLEVTRDGSAAFVALPAGIFRVRPTPLLMTPDVDNVFQVHPDGSVLAVTAADQGPTGLLYLYKISVDQALTGAPHLSDLTPCAIVAVPNNRGTSSLRVTTFVSFAADPVSTGAGDATVLLSFLAGGGPDVLSPSLRVAGTVAISSPAGSPTCTVLGLVNLQPLALLTF